MKKLTTLLILTGLTVLSFLSCSQESNYETKKDSTVATQPKTHLYYAFDNFEKCLGKNIKEFQFLADNPNIFKDRADTRVRDLIFYDKYTKEEIDLSPLLVASSDLLESMDFNDNDLYQLTNNESIKSINDLSNEGKLNLALLSYAAKEELVSSTGSYFVNVGKEIDWERAQQLINKNNYQLDSLSDSISITRATLNKWTIIGCIGYAFGFNDALSKGFFPLVRKYGSRQLKSLVVAVALRIGVKSLTGIGAAITAAEVAYCIYDHTHNTRIYSVDDYQRSTPDWWYSGCGYTEEEAQQMTVILFNHKREMIYSTKPLLRENKGIEIFEYRVSKEDLPDSFLGIH